jgi:hypothetical protein
MIYRIAYTFGEAQKFHTYFPEVPNLKVLLPERFRGGCSFGDICNPMGSVFSSSRVIGFIN